MKHLVGYAIKNAHQVRRWHPETCCCSTDYVVEATYRKGVDHSTDSTKIVYTGDLESCKAFIKGMPQ